MWNSVQVIIKGTIELLNIFICWTFEELLESDPNVLHLNPEADSTSHEHCFYFTDIKV